MAGAGLELVDAIDGVKINGVDGEAVEGVGGEGDDVAAVEAVSNVADERGLWLVGMDAESFGRQNLAPVLLLIGGCHPLNIAQSLPSVGFSSVLRIPAADNFVQSLPGKEVDSACDGTFFNAGFHSSG